MTKRKLVIIQQTENNDYIKELAKTWSQCCFYMIKKNRFCNIEKTPNSEYCGNHRPVEEGTTNRISKKFRLDALETTADNSQRCPCPVDPTHTIYTRNLKSHVLICTATTHNQQMEREPFYKKNCNSGLFIEAETSVDESTEVNCESLVHKIKQCYQGLAVESLSELTHEADKIKIDESDTNNAETCILDAMKVYLTSKNVQRHIQQNVQIVKRMLTSGLLIPTNPTASDIAYVELGAGKGMLGLAVSAVSPRSTVVLVERSGVRQKVDRTMRKQEGQCYRARMDIRHTYLRGLPGVSSTSSALNPTSSVLPEDSKASEERSVVVVANHVYGLIM